MLKVTGQMREAARRLLARSETHISQHKRLEAIVNGKRKLIDAAWWRKLHGDVDRATLGKVAALADPARNPSEHERANAARTLAKLKARRLPGMPREAPPLPETLAQFKAMRKPRQTRPSAPPTSSRSPRPSVASPPAMSDSVAALKALNERRSALRAALRAGRKCEVCGKPLAARRATARYCGPTCRSKAWRHRPA